MCDERSFEVDIVRLLTLCTVYCRVNPGETARQERWLSRYISHSILTTFPESNF